MKHLLDIFLIALLLAIIIPLIFRATDELGSQVVCDGPLGRWEPPAEVAPGRWLLAAVREAPAGEAARARLVIRRLLAEWGYHPRRGSLAGWLPDERSPGQDDLARLLASLGWRVRLVPERRRRFMVPGTIVRKQGGGWVLILSRTGYKRRVFEPGRGELVVQWSGYSGLLAGERLEAAPPAHLK